MVEIIAHRGASYDAPENTLASVRLGWEQNADAVEIDCRLTHDRQIVVIHDANTRRVAGQRLFVAESTLDELRRLEYGRWKGTDWAGEPVPSLAEVLATIPTGKRLFIEVKCSVEIVPVLTELLGGSGRPLSQFAVISYYDPVLAGMKRAIPDMATYLVARTPRHAESKGADRVVHELIARCQLAAIDGLDVEAGPIVDDSFVAIAGEAGLGCYVWTVDNAREARRLVAAGVRGITTNRPAWLREQLSS